MENNQFKTPLLQSAILLGVLVILFVIAGASGNGESGSSVAGLFSGIGNTIMFLIGIAISLVFSIVVLIGIFLAAVAMVDREQASAIWSDLKKKLLK